MKKCLLTLFTAVAIGAGLASPASALTPYSVGVKDIDVAPHVDQCEAGQALPCTTGHGTGSSNVLRVTQHDTGSGMAFDQFSTTAQDDEDLWMSARIGAECRTGHRLFSASFRPEYRYDAFRQDVEEVAPYWDSAGVSVPHAKEMPAKTVALDIPLEDAFEGNGGIDGFVLDFSSLDDVIEAGEDKVAERVANGKTEDEARSMPFSIDTWLEMHADVRCESTVGHRVYVKRMPIYLPLEIEYVAVPMPAPAPVLPPARDRGHGTGLSIPGGVTDASIAVVTDPEDPCTLHLSGTITASIDTEVEYRFIDEYGQRSNGFRIDVLADQPTFFSHDVAVPSADDDGGTGFTTLDPHHGIGGYAVEDTDLETGTYQIEVSAPNLVLSTIDGYSVPPCA